MPAHLFTPYEFSGQVQNPDRALPWLRPLLVGCAVVTSVVAAISSTGLPNPPQNFAKGRSRSHSRARWQFLRPFGQRYCQKRGKKAVTWGTEISVKSLRHDRAGKPRPISYRVQRNLIAFVTSSAISRISPRSRLAPYPP